MLRSAVGGRPGGASSRASTFIAQSRSHLHHTSTRASPALNPTTGEERRPTPWSESAIFDTTSSTRTSGGSVPVTASSSSRGFFRSSLDLKFGRLNVGGVYSLAQAGKSTATALGEEGREESSGGGGGGGGDLTSFRLTGKPDSIRVYEYEYTPGCLFILYQ